MTGIIFSNKTIQPGVEQLFKMFEYWEKSGDVITKKFSTSDNISIELNHKDLWKVVVPNEKVRGLRCNIALIDKNIPQEIVERIIMPMATNPIWSAIGYY